MISLMMMALAAQSTAPMAAVQPAPQQPLNLTCVGAGAANKTMSKTVHTDSKIRDKGGVLDKGKVSTTKTVSENYKQDFFDQVDVRLFSGDDKIRIPRVMLPELHGGQGGWFKLKNVVADSRSIKASASLAFLSNPKIYIDRLTGIITISGNAGDFSGQCQVIDPNAPARF